MLREEDQVLLYLGKNKKMAQINENYLKFRPDTCSLKSDGGFVNFRKKIRRPML